MELKHAREDCQLRLSIIVNDADENGIERGQLHLHDVCEAALKNLPVGKSFMLMYDGKKTFLAPAECEEHIKTLADSTPYWEKVDYFDTMTIMSRSEDVIEVIVLGRAATQSDGQSKRHFVKAYKKVLAV